MSRFVASAYTKAQEDNTEDVVATEVPEITEETIVVPEEEVEAKVELEAGLEALETAVGEAELVETVVEKGDELVETTDAIVAKAEGDLDAGETAETVEAAIPEGAIVETVVATENLKMILRLPLDDSSVAYESFSTDKLAQLKLASEGFKEILAQAKAHAKKIWEWIVEQFKTLMSYVKTNGYTIDRKKAKVRAMWDEKTAGKTKTVLDESEGQRVAKNVAIGGFINNLNSPKIDAAGVKAALTLTSADKHQVGGFVYTAISGSKILCSGKVFDITETEKKISIPEQLSVYEGMLKAVEDINFVNLEKDVKAGMKTSSDAFATYKKLLESAEKVSNEDMAAAKKGIVAATLNAAQNISGRIKFADRVLNTVVLAAKNAQ